MKDLREVFKRFEGDPVEIITESGFKFCGIDIDADDDKVKIIDKKGRVVDILYSHIDAVVEPQRKLSRICGNNDCECEDVCKKHGHSSHCEMEATCDCDCRCDD